MSAFDYSVDDGFSTGHTHKRYYVKWTGSSFKEYKGTKITQAKLKKYSGAASILKKARSLGYSIGTIFKRSNGIINVNLYKYEYGGRVNENLTLKISGSKVTLVPAAWRFSDSPWIEKYSYGGVYKASGF